MRRVMVLVAGLLLVVGLGVPGVALAGEGCPNEQLRAENSSLGLPDCRAFEMVTPADKNGAVVNPVDAPTVAADGSSVVGRSPEAFAGIENDEVGENQNDAFYRFSRSGSGWVTVPLNPYRGELASIGFGDSVWMPAEARSVARLRLRGAGGGVSEIGPMWPPADGQNQNREPGLVRGVAAEAVDGVVFSVSEPGFLWPFDSTISGRSLYEYTGTGNTTPGLVGVSGGAGSTVLVSQCGTQLGARDNAEGAGNAVSESGGTVFFTAVGADSNACGGVQPPANELFARIDGERTVAISEPSGADCPLCDTSAPADAVFQGASADGSRVFFTTGQPLLGADTSENLYEYNFDAPAGESKIVRVSAGDGSVSEPTAEVQSVAEISEDGSHVYFLARGVLTKSANSMGEHAQAGGENFYLYERDAQYPAGRTVFIAGCGDVGDGQSTPDGDFLVLTSTCHLTAGDVSTARQVFQYDAQTSSMARVSVGLEGYNDDGNVTGDDINDNLDAHIVTQQNNYAARGGALARSMSDDGAYVFFQSPVGLTPQALNDLQVAEDGRAPVYAQNVYEYHAGRVWLIDSDSSLASLELDPGVPVLIGVSASGGDVFFRTGDQLVPGDTDTDIDFYDARIDGGFPAPVMEAGCVGDACQGSASSPPAFGVPSSVAFSGGGNLAPLPVSGPVVVQAKALTAAQKLARALKVCLKDPKRKRGSCRAAAKRLYAHTSRAVKSDRRGK